MESTQILQRVQEKEEPKVTDISSFRAFIISAPSLTQGPYLRETFLR